jgi:LmbE family N-acetylglucosaminyl deacetylase
MSEIPLISDRTNQWVFLSPHLDDAVYSCGGLISFLSEKGINTEIWTVFSEQEQDASRLTSYAKTLHKRWQAGDYPYITRKNEDEKACLLVGANKTYFGYPDCIYRKFPDTDAAVVMSDEDLFGPINFGEIGLVKTIAVDLQNRIVEPSIWVCPLGLGGHLDHRIVRAATEMTGKPVLYYADLPYAIGATFDPVPGMIQMIVDIPQLNCETWKKGVIQYGSQLSSFWENEEEMSAQYDRFIASARGFPLWFKHTARAGTG